MTSISFFLEYRNKKARITRFFMLLLFLDSYFLRRAQELLYAVRFLLNLFYWRLVRRFSCTGCTKARVFRSEGVISGGLDISDSNWWDCNGREAISAFLPLLMFFGSERNFSYRKSLRYIRQKCKFSSFRAFGV